MSIVSDLSLQVCEAGRNEKKEKKRADYLNYAYGISLFQSWHCPLLLLRVMGLSSEPTKYEKQANARFQFRRKSGCFDTFVSCYCVFFTVYLLRWCECVFSRLECMLNIPFGFLSFPLLLPFHLPRTFLSSPTLVRFSSFSSRCGCASLAPPPHTHSDALASSLH